MVTTVGMLETGKDNRELRPFSLVAADIPVMWEQLEPFIERSCKHSRGTITTAVVKEMLCGNRAVCMGTARGNEPVSVFVVQITDYHTYRAATMIAVAGKELREAMEFEYILTEWATALGATELEAWCRPSMARLLRRFGYEPRFTVVSKSLRRRYH